MRITGGRARSIPLRAPKGDGTRPATDRLREAVFSSLGAEIEGARVLDAFAGTGAYGLEALSRGAAHVTFIESDAAAFRCLSSNLDAVAKSLGLSDSRAVASLLQANVFKVALAERFDVIFADPPYELLRKDWQTLLPRLAGFLEPDGLLMLEAPGDFETSAVGCGLKLRKRLGKGRDQPSALIFEREAEYCLTGDSLSEAIIKHHL